MIIRFLWWPSPSLRWVHLSPRLLLYSVPSPPLSLGHLCSCLLRVQRVPYLQFLYQGLTSTCVWVCQCFYTFWYLSGVLCLLPHHLKSLSNLAAPLPPLFSSYLSSFSLIKPLLLHLRVSLIWRLGCLTFCFSPTWQVQTLDNLKLLQYLQYSWDVKDQTLTR